VGRLVAACAAGALGAAGFGAGAAGFFWSAAILATRATIKSRSRNEF